jgi:hypothetical protein
LMVPSSLERSTFVTATCGTGDVDTIAGVGGRAGSNEPLPGVAPIARDDCGNSRLPPTTLKGLLDRRAHLPHDQVEDLFGSIKHSENERRDGGALLPRGAIWQAPAPDDCAILCQGGRRSAETCTRGRPHGDRCPAGVADDHKLYFQKWCPRALPSQCVSS